MKPPAARILVIDDTPAVLRATVRVLADAGFEVSEASSGEAGLAAAIRDMPDLALLDVALPDIDGNEVCRRIKTDPRTAGIFVVHCSAARNAADNALEAPHTGAEGFIERPIGARELVARVRAYLRHKGAVDGFLDREAQDRDRQELSLQEAYADEMRTLAREAGDDPAPVSARLLGTPRLSEAAPETFREILADYATLLEQAHHQRVYRTENELSPRLLAMADRLFRLKAGARDVTELHYHALRARTQREEPARARRYLEAGRLAVLELMGHLLNAYRTHHIGSRALHPASTKTSPTP